MARYNVSYIASFPDQTAAWEPAGSEVIVRTDRTGRWRSKAINPHFESDFVGISRGDFPGKRPVFEQALAHFKTRMGRPAAETLWTQRGRDVALAMSGEEPRGFSLDHPGFGGSDVPAPAAVRRRSDHRLRRERPARVRRARVARNGAGRRLRSFPGERRGAHLPRLSPGNAGAQYRADDVDIACGSEGQPVLFHLEPGEWLVYTVHVPTAGNYRIDVRYAAAGAGGAIRVGFGGSDVTGDVALRRNRRRRAPPPSRPASR